MNQTYKKLELLIVDDCSTDHTKKILNTKYSKNNNIKLFFNSKNLGLTKSLNHLIKHTSGNLIARQDADDISLPKRLETQIKYFESTDIDFCTTRATRMNSNIKIPKVSYLIPKKILVKVKNPFIHGTLMIKKEVLKKVGCYDEKFFYAQDYKLFSDLLKNNHLFKEVKKPLYILNMENNISTNKKNEQEYYASCVRNNIVPEQ